MKVYGITVTYGNRFQFVEKLLYRLIEIGIHKTIIVDNDSTTESRDQLVALASKLPIITLLSLHQNIGSAGGFKQGLMYAHAQPDCESIWLLDDDNLPDIMALTCLTDFYNEIGENCCLISLRKARVPYRKIHNTIDVKRKFRPYNSFVNFNIFHGIRKKFLFSLKRKKHDIVPIPYGPYGGMFFHKQMLDVIGYPNGKMFLYLDDHEFSQRIIAAGASIYLVRKSVVEDMETSWHGIKKYRFFQRFMLLIDGDEHKSFYTIRNLIYLEKKCYIRNTVQYAVNRVLFKIIYYSLCYLLNKQDRIKMFKQAYESSSTLD